MKKLILIFHTVRHLKLSQIFYQIYYRIFKNLLNHKIKSKEDHFLSRSFEVNKFSWKQAKLRKLCFHDKKTVTFLNLKENYESRNIWNDTLKSKIWLYNLHYLDDLPNSTEQDIPFYRDLVHRWIDENPPAEGNGWEPYTLSLRIVNIIKWISEYNLYEETKIIKSVYHQTYALSLKIEHHILANHIFENAKALMFAGSFFKDSYSKKWFSLGMKLIERELEEQFLDDGGHFELSPMYHSLMIENIIDLYKLTYINKNKTLNDKLKTIISSGLYWLQLMSHPNSELAFFNDTTLGIALNINELRSYADITPLKEEHQTNENFPKISHLKCSGFFVIELSKQDKVIFNIGIVSPSYQPGHTHSDELSIEASLSNRRIITNNGFSTYDNSEERLLERSSSRKSCPTVDNKSHTEIWSSFRVARRCKIVDVTQNEERISATIKTFNSKTLKRTILFSNEGFSITDELISKDDNPCELLNTNFYIINSNLDAKSTKSISTQYIDIKSNTDFSLTSTHWVNGFNKKSPAHKISLNTNNKKIHVTFSKGIIQ